MTAPERPADPTPEEAAVWLGRHFLREDFQEPCGECVAYLRALVQAAIEKERERAATHIRSLQQQMPAAAPTESIPDHPG